MRKTPLCVAVENEDHDKVAGLVAHAPVEDLSQCLLLACSHGHSKCAKLLLAANAAFDALAHASRVCCAQAHRDRPRRKGHVASLSFQRNDACCRNLACWRRLGSAKVLAHIQSQK